MRWISEATSDDESGRTSSTRIAVLTATITLSISTLVLTFGVFWNPDLVPALSVVGGGLAGTSGASYVANRFGHRRGRVDNPDD